MTLLPFGGGERVCLGKALAELEIRLLAVGLLKQLTLELEPAQDLSLSIIPTLTQGRLAGAFKPQNLPFLIRFAA